MTMQETAKNHAHVLPRVTLRRVGCWIGVAFACANGAWAGEPIPVAALVSGSAREIRSAIASGADLGARYENDATAAHIAAAGPTTEALSTLLSLGAEVNSIDRARATPLHVAIYHDRPNNAVLLIERGAELDAQDGLGRTPVHLAIERKNPEALEILIRARANLEAHDARGMSPLVMAALSLEPRLTRLLVDAGASLDNPRVLPSIVGLVEEMQAEGAPPDVLRDATEVQAILRGLTRSAPASRR